MTKPNWDLHHLPWGVGLTYSQIKVYDPTDDTDAYTTLPVEHDKHKIITFKKNFKIKKHVHVF